MADKRPLLDNGDSEAECGGSKAQDAFSLTTGITFKSIQNAPTILWISRQILCRRKLILAVILVFVCSYFLIYPAGVLDLDSMDNIVTVRHHSNVLDMEVVAQTVPPAPPATPATQLESKHPTKQTIDSKTLLPQGYLVYSNSCRIAELDPYKRDVMIHFKRKQYKACKQLLPLTQVRYDPSTQRYVLSINSTSFTSYKVNHVLSCCYSTVLRINEGSVGYAPCQDFKTKAELSNTTDNIIVKCSTETDQIYINGHATIPERVEIRQRLNQWKAQDQGKRVPSVLMIGIDSISRVNLIRAMPKTAQYLYDNEWFELAGYNKIDDNTFPNIMAVMVGYNMDNAIKYCNPYKITGLNNCDFIWKQFQEHGYVTAYGEDAIKINTFNYLKMGFKTPPVDYYLRPYLKAAEKLLDVDVAMGLPHCLGFQTEAEHVYNYALEFANRYRNDTFFGFFWTNTHSHSDISQTSSMDDYLKDYLHRLVAQGTMEHSVVIFFSDHGLRFGPTRATWSGHFEERLPFIFIWLPKFMREAHPEFVEALHLNRNRLTTPYDLHVTLKHILSMTGRPGTELVSLDGAKDCPQCQSLLLPVPLNRRCEDVGIEAHWCTCWAYDSVYTNSKIVRHIAKGVVQHLNDFITNFRNGSMGHLCMPLSLQSVNAAYKAHLNDMDLAHIEVYWLIFHTSPNKGQYEATVRYNKSLPDDENVQVTGSVSRLNMYNNDANCMKDFAIKKYCYCRNKSG